MGKQSTSSLKQHDIHLLHVETRGFDVFIEYQHENRIYQAVFPLAMLDAEVDGWLLQTSFVPEDQHEQA